MLDEERYQAIREELRPEVAQSWRMLEELDRKLEEVDSREQLREELYRSPNSNHGLYCLISLAQIVGNQEFEQASKEALEQRRKTR